MTRHMLAMRTLDPKQIAEILDRAAQIKETISGGGSVSRLRQKSVGLLFFENSTRTRVSFEQAAHYLGFNVVNFSGSGSSMSKGETLKDTILTLKYEGLDSLVMRHKASGSALFAASYFGGPVINAGDGEHEHPTQALGDALTILERKGDIQGLKVAIVGDVAHSRVARSNAWLLSKLGAEVRFVGPKTLIPTHTSKLPAAVHYDLATGISEADVIICLRLQRERMSEGLLSSTGEYARMYQINRSSLRNAANEAIVLHPGPMNRGVEIDDTVADSEVSCINDQVSNCVFVRTAVLEWVFEESREEQLASQ